MIERATIALSKNYEVISMTDKEMKKKLDESVDFFEEFINIVLPQNLEGVKPMDVMRHYNTVRTELSKLYVDVD